MENKTPKLNYDILREQLILVTKEFGACEPFFAHLECIKDKNSFRQAIVNTYSDVADKFGIDCDCDCDCDEVDDDDSDAKDDEISELQDELKVYETRFGKIHCLSDEWKAQFFSEYREKYTEWELKHLFENGKKYLQGIDVLI